MAPSDEGAGSPTGETGGEKKGGRYGKVSRKDYSKEQLQRIVEQDGHPDAVAVARELLEKKFGQY